MPRSYTRELGVFYQKLAQLHRGGVPLLESLPMVIEQVPSADLQNGLTKVLSAVTRGATLTQAVTRQQDVFPPLHVALISVGESQGRLDQCLSRLAEMCAEDHSARSEIARALRYPLFLLLSAALLPPLATWYTQGFFPYAKEVLGSLSHVALPAAAAYAAVRAAQALVPETLDGLLLALPLVGRLLRNQAFARFCRALGALLSGGVELRSGMPLALSALGNRALTRRCAGVQAGIDKGEPLGSSMLAARGFPLELVQGVAVAERAGQLDQTLQQMAQEYDAEAARARRDLVKALPVVVFLFVAYRVAVSVLGFYMGYIDNLDRMDRIMREADVPISRYESPAVAPCSHRRS